MDGISFSLGQLPRDDWALTKWSEFFVRGAIEAAIIDARVEIDTAIRLIVLTRSRQPFRLRGPHPDPARLQRTATISETGSTRNFRHFSAELYIKKTSP